MAQEQHDTAKQAEADVYDDSYRQTAQQRAEATDRRMPNDSEADAAPASPNAEQPGSVPDPAMTDQAEQAQATSEQAIREEFEGPDA